MVYLAITSVFSVVLPLSLRSYRLKTRNVCDGGTATLLISNDMTFRNQGDSVAVGFLGFEFPILQTMNVEFPYQNTSFLERHLFFSANPLFYH